VPATLRIPQFFRVEMIVQEQDNVGHGNITREICLMKEIA
jgi:hypothetical protein